MPDSNDIWSQFVEFDPLAAAAAGNFARTSKPYVPARSPPPASRIINGQTIGEFVNALGKPKTQFGMFGRGPDADGAGLRETAALTPEQPAIRPRRNPFDERRGRILQFVDTPYWRAFGTTIGQAEGTGYGSVNNGKPLNHSFDPAVDSYPGRAAGLFQIEPPNYDAVGRRYLGIDDFTPRSQNMIAAQLVENAHAMPLLMQGDLSRALPALSKIWASLPQGPAKAGRYPQPYKSYDVVISTYSKALRDELARERFKRSAASLPVSP